jgi:hypothetical protein
MRETDARGRNIFSNRGHAGYREKTVNRRLRKRGKVWKAKKKFGIWPPERGATCHNAQLEITYDKVSLPAGRLLPAAGGAMPGLDILNRVACGHERMLL